MPRAHSVLACPHDRTPPTPTPCSTGPAPGPPTTPTSETRAELGAIVADGRRPAATPADLADRFAGTLEFGTAGLRGALGAGPNRMNRVVVIRAAAGLAAYLRDTGATRGAPS